MRDTIEAIRDGIEELRAIIRPRPRRGYGFAAGIAVGLVGGLAGVVLAVAAQRRHRRSRAGISDSQTFVVTGADDDAPSHGDEIDEELAQTFPASDPLPQSHRVD